MPMKAPKIKTRSKPAAGRVKADIPAGIPHSTAADLVFGGPEVVVRDCILENLAVTDCSFRSVVIEACILKRVSFTRSKLMGLRLRDVRLVECDFANAEVTGLKAVRVEFVNCRLTPSSGRSRMPGLFDFRRRSWLFSISLWRLQDE
jgi:uncharacterized protein YjbI with pentapeptide repeats